MKSDPITVFLSPELFPEYNKVINKSSTLLVAFSLVHHEIKKLILHYALFIEHFNVVFKM